MAIRVLEIGLGLPVAYAGMLLQQQGAEVQKWTGESRDPLADRGPSYLRWVHEGKALSRVDAKDVLNLRPMQFAIVLDNLRQETWDGWGVNRGLVAHRCGMAWVSLEDDTGYRSTGGVAEARSWLSEIGWVPEQLAETSAGLWMAFKAMTVYRRPGHYRLGFAAVLQKMLPGELTGLRERKLRVAELPGQWMRDGVIGGGQGDWRDDLLQEPTRDRQWKLQHLRHRHGRIIV